MAYDEAFAARIRALLTDSPDLADHLTEKRMFGGLAFLYDGNMAVAVHGHGGLMVRVDPDEHESLLAEPGAATMVMRDRPLDGWITVDAKGCEADEDLDRWARRGLATAATFPAK
ncbi:TfoX/Sxy family protein [Glycomyces buryatensis]|uniref:TfoX/Sxy family protein n=1 Tax=Glycomyces buryatensis TaxID=2570927 RepID=A0A4S8QB94_9ACTN|nr:TfoX/Sxy family protein [Glycomyces buryatensis]THV41540.1 TfoX/Sxy family protein [Glycomyces buryatensis]